MANQNHHHNLYFNHKNPLELTFMTIHFLAANEPLIVDGKPRLGYFDDALPIDQYA
jgi:hypothetical protein